MCVCVCVCVCEREREREIEANGEKERKEGVGILGCGLPATHMSEQRQQALQRNDSDIAVQCFNPLALELDPYSLSHHLCKM